MKQRSPLTTDEQEKAKILHASGKTVCATARALGRSPHTVKKFLRKPEVVREVSVQREHLAGMFDDVAERTLEGVTDEDVTKASLQQKMVSAGIAIDKSAMLRGQLPPVLNVTLLLDIASSIRRERDERDPGPTLPALPPHDPADPQGQP